MTDRDVGGMGEAEFTKWCNSIGLAANKFHEDKTGKDFLVEFPLDKDAKHIHEAAITARVQVKSTDGKRRGEQIKLSNLKRLATEPGPSFIAFIEFDGQDDPQQAFLVHIDKKWITKILKRIQENNNPDPAKKAKKKKKPKRGKRGPKKKPSDGTALNKATIKVKYDKKHKLSKPNGQSLKIAIQSAVPIGMHAYVEAKQKHLESTGWEETYGSVTFSVADEKNITGLVDVSLGLKDCVEVKDPTFTPSRFGIVTRKDVSYQPKGWIAMPKLSPTSKGQLKFTDVNLAAPLVFDVEVYNSPFNSPDQPEFAKLRIVADWFEVHLHPFVGKFQINFSAGDGKPVELSHLQKLLRMMRLLENAQRGTMLRLCIETFPDLEFGFGGKNPGIDFGINTDELVNAAKDAQFLVNDFGITERVDVTLSELKDHASHIQEMAMIAVNEKRHWRSVFPGDALIPKPDKQLAAVSFASAKIGEFQVGQFLVLCGIPTKTAEGHWLETTECHREARMVTERRKTYDFDEHIRLMQQIIDRYQSDYQMFVMCNDEVAKSLRFKQD